MRPPFNPSSCFSKSNGPVLRNESDCRIKVADHAKARSVQTWFAEDPPPCILAGTVSGHLMMILFDLEAELFDRGCDLVATESPALRK
jgi:hypothetical protein